MNDDRFSEHERAAILRDAAERSTADSDHYSLAEIQAIAREADIAPQFVAQAAASLTRINPPPSSTLWGDRSDQHLVRRIEHAATPAEIQTALAVARLALGQTGETRDAGGAVEWRYDSGYSSCTVSILADDSETIVRVDGRADGRRFVLYFGAVGVAVLTGFVATRLVAPTFSAATAVAALVPCLAIARAWWNQSARAMSARLTALADELARRLAKP